MLDFSPPANLEWVDYSKNCIKKIERVQQNPYLKYVFLDENEITQIEQVMFNKSMVVLSLRANNITKIENLDDMWLEELNIAENQIRKITGLNKLKVLRELDLSQNRIEKLEGLQDISSLRFLNVSMNNIQKVLQLQHIEQLSLLTDLDLCFNPIQNKKHYRSQALFHIPQLRMLDGQEITGEEKVKAENLHGVDLNDREKIFLSQLPEEKFVDRRLFKYEDIDVESEDDDCSNSEGRPKALDAIANQTQSTDRDRNEAARQYVGELFTNVAG